MPPARTSINTHDGMPSELRAHLVQASRGGAGYEQAGFALGRIMGRECPMDAELDEWGVDDAMLARWLRETFPKVMSQVPARRELSFAAGVRRAHEEGLI